MIYAADPRTIREGSEASQRPFETIIPLAARVNLQPVITYAQGDEVPLAKEIVGLSGVVLVSWEHKAIAKVLLPAIAMGQNLPGIPRKWDGNRYDIVLRFDRVAPGAPWSFRQLFPRLLSGDSNLPMK